tara:strand:+ start:2358 stop:2954 length:597 start_codon:yes stop_codon:yes gene_type:complete
MAQILNRKLRDAHIAHPDGRRREHKAAVRRAYESTIDELVEQLEENEYAVKISSKKIKQLQRQVRASGAAEETLRDNTCLICTDVMDGNVTLRCGHEMCPECFAQHSRVNNTCPFCRDEFASKVKVRNKLPIEGIEAIAETWAMQTRATGYFTNHLRTNRAKFMINAANAEDHLEWLVRENAKILMNQIKGWYDSEND